MKLISDIINDLVDSNASLSNALLKTKVLASKIDNKELLSWVNKELEGYPDSENLPRYRIYLSSIIGNYISGTNQFNNHPIPISGIDPDLEDFMSSMKFQQSISSLEQQLKTNKSGSLEFPMPAEVIGLIQRNLVAMGNQHIQLINVRLTTSISAVQEILASVRNKLLEFMLEIDKEFGALTEIEDLKSKTKEITHIMNKTIIKTSGDGNIINTGDGAKIKAEININKGDKEELTKYLDEIGVSNEDAHQLVQIIDEASPSNAEEPFSEKVNQWMLKMIEKAAKGTWQVGIGAAGGLLAEGIKAYYGF